jgi:FlaA1/EpsC-like NDP-sugar epimerase
MFAWLLRFDFSFPNRWILLSALPLLVLIRLVAMALFHLFHGYWRYTGMSDVLDIVKAVSSGSVVFLIAERWIFGVKLFPVSIYFIEAILTGGALCGVRMLSRAFMQSVQNQVEQSNSRSVVVIGAGDGAAMLLQELPRAGYNACALVDDDPSKSGVKLHGVRVVGKISDLEDVARRYCPGELMIAIPSATREEMGRITEHCQRTGLRFRTIPGLTDLINGKVTVDQLREVRLEDLLGRATVDFNLDLVKSSVAGRVVMVTGAAGSIGSELCRQLLSYAPARLVCVDHAETPLFSLQNAILESKIEKVYCVADVTNKARVRDIIQDYDVRVIFHAAAYKHVPLMEMNVPVAIDNNVFGLLSLLEAADEAGCEDFVLISSDKAVNPTSLMGCTKRIGELIIAARPSRRMRCLSVRFGNVLGSQGSVIPVFQEQIKTKHQITVTHPDITRYFMTISEAVSLVLQAFSVGENSDILVLDMGKPVRILDMAHSLIGLSGIPQDEVKIVFTGLRPGEKLYEELFYDFELRMSTPLAKVFRTKGQRILWPELKAHLSDLRAESMAGVSDRIRSKVKEIIPQYEWSPVDESCLTLANVREDQRFAALHAEQSRPSDPIGNAAFD